MQLEWRTLVIAVSVALPLSLPSLALDLVRDGKPAATIILPSEPNATEQRAAQALVKYLKMSSGAELEILPESSPRLRPAPAGSPRLTLISVGRTEMAKAAGASDKDLKYDGYRLLVKGGQLYLLGRDTPRVPKMSGIMGAQGTWRAALGFLEKLGFRWIEPTEKGVYVPRFKTVTVADDLDVTFNPPFMYAIGRMTGQGDWSMANGFRSSVNIYSEGGHTWHTFVPASLWDTHPEYFQMRDGKRVKPEGDGYFLCPSNPDVQKLLADGIRKKFDEGYDLVQLGQSDGYQPCECPACRALDKPGEWHEQIQIPHYNVIQMVRKTHPDKKVHLLIYDVASQPSAKIAQYPDNVVMEICATGMLADAFGGDQDAGIRYWASRTPNGGTVYVYYMGLYHDEGLAPKFTPQRMAAEIQRLHRLGVRGIYFCGGGENWGAEGPTYYVAGRMMNDPTQDWSKLVDEYCALTFGKAGPTMRRYYDLVDARLDSGALSLAGSFQESHAVLSAMFPPDALKQLRALLDSAREQAAGDERALGWLRLAELSYRHFAAISKAYHLYDALEFNRTTENLRQLAGALKEYRDLSEQVMNGAKTAPNFVRDFFPFEGYWTGYEGGIKTNCGHLRAPFTWNLDGVRVEEDYGTAPGKVKETKMWDPVSTPGRHYLKSEVAENSLIFTCPPVAENPEPFGYAGGPGGDLSVMNLVLTLRMKCTFATPDSSVALYYTDAPKGWLMNWAPGRINDAYDAKSKIDVDTTQWQTYKIVARMPDDVRLYVEGVPGEGIRLKSFQHTANYFQLRVYGHGSKVEIARCRLEGVLDPQM